MSKYQNKKTIVDGIEFDSKREANHYRELRLLERAGKIQHLRRQVRYQLIPAQYENIPQYGKNGLRIQDKRVCVERELSYIADFTYQQDGKLVVEDVKGYRTSAYTIKRKLMLFMHGVKIKEV